MAGLLFAIEVNRQILRLLTLNLDGKGSHKSQQFENCKIIQEPFKIKRNTYHRRCLAACWGAFPPFSWHRCQTVTVAPMDEAFSTVHLTSIFALP